MLQVTASSSYISDSSCYYCLLTLASGFNENEVGITKFRHRNGDLADLLEVGYMQWRQLTLASRCLIAIGAHIRSFCESLESHSKQFLITERNKT